jgi:hypothetical protein
MEEKKIIKEYHKKVVELQEFADLIAKNIEIAYSFLECAVIDNRENDIKSTIIFINEQKEHHKDTLIKLYEFISAELDKVYKV